MTNNEDDVQKYGLCWNEFRQHHGGDDATHQTTNNNPWHRFVHNRHREEKALFAAGSDIILHMQSGKIIAKCDRHLSLSRTNVGHDGCNVKCIHNI